MWSDILLSIQHTMSVRYMCVWFLWISANDSMRDEIAKSRNSFNIMKNEIFTRIISFSLSNLFHSFSMSLLLSLFHFYFFFLSLFYSATKEIASLSQFLHILSALSPTFFLLNGEKCIFIIKNVELCAVTGSKEEQREKNEMISFVILQVSSFAVSYISPHLGSIIYYLLSPFFFGIFLLFGDKVITPEWIVRKE